MSVSQTVWQLAHVFHTYGLGSNFGFFRTLDQLASLTKLTIDPVSNFIVNRIMFIFIGTRWHFGSDCYEDFMVTISTKSSITQI